LVTNEAARCAADASMPSRVALLGRGVPLTRLFSPEHGLAATGVDGAPMRDGVDALTELPIVSLYGDRFAPSPESLADLDAILFDIPDVGARFYTYAWTLSHVLEAAARTGMPVVVLDRPNPLGGDLPLTEGPMLDETCCSSFVGRWTMPIRHSLTLGELARYWAATRVPGVNLRVVRCSGWNRAMLWPDCGTPWVPTSPSMPSFESALLYPGTCLFEATNLSLGRGTDLPFQVVAAPWLDAERVCRNVVTHAVAGVSLHASAVTPSIGPSAGTGCSAVRIVVHEPGAVRPVALGLALLAVVMQLHPTDFAWSPYPTAANPSGQNHFARLSGVRWLGPLLGTLREAPAAELLGEWTATGRWAREVGPALLYPAR